MTEKQKHMLQQALEALSNAYCEKKKYYIAANDYATAKIEDVLALEEEEEQEALLVYDKVGLSRRAISKIKREPVDPRNYAEEVLE